VGKFAILGYNSKLSGKVITNFVPYHSWERGLNEHTNGLIRQFYPKSTNFKIVKEDDFQKVVNLINHRPRKSLDYRTPREVFFGASEPVALQI